MKKNLNRSLILTAVTLTLGAAAAYGQNNITANIPFEFHASGAAYAAGTYHLATASENSPVFQLRGDATRNIVNLRIGVPESGSANSAIRSRLVFHCSDAGGCVLAQVWNADGRGWSFPTPRVKASQLESMRVVDLKNAARN